MTLRGQNAVWMCSLHPIEVKEVEMGSVSTPSHLRPGVINAKCLRRGKFIQKHETKKPLQDDWRTCKKNSPSIAAAGGRERGGRKLGPVSESLGLSCNQQGALRLDICLPFFSDQRQDVVLYEGEVTRSKSGKLFSVI